jgi:hypothetical protein
MILFVFIIMAAFFDYDEKYHPLLWKVLGIKRKEVKKDGTKI